VLRGLTAVSALLLASGEAAALTLTSPAFVDGGEIPSAHTCEGTDTSPPLAWAGAPDGTRSFVLIVDDPDAPDPNAPRTIWVHWVVYDLPASSAGLPAGASPTGLPAAAREGLNDWKASGYRGPCPPIGRHRYVHTLYALDMNLPALDHPSRQDVERAMAGHVIGQAKLVGTYEKRRGK